VEGDVVKNRAGEDVILTQNGDQTGSNRAIGHRSGGDITTGLVTVTAGQDEDTAGLSRILKKILRMDLAARSARRSGADDQ
jgi:hypothetical protein